MKSYILCKINATSYKLGILVFVLLTLFLESCSKVKNDNLLSGEDVNLVIKVNGLETPVDDINLRASSSRLRSAGSNHENGIKERIEENDLVIDVSSNQVVNTIDLVITDGMMNRNKLAAAKIDTMGNGIRYRVLIYKSSGEFVASMETTVNKEEHLTVASGETYNWYAYSYNSSAVIPAPNYNNPTLTTSVSSPLLYASGTIKPTTAGTILPITFKHMLTQLKVQVREASEFRAILQADGKFVNENYVKTSNFDIRTGLKIGAMTSAKISNLTFVRGTGFDSLSQIAHYYTADNNIASFQVKMNAIEVQYTALNKRTLTTDLPNGGVLNFSFSNTPVNKAGYSLKGLAELNFLLPTMKILPFSNADDGNTYRLAEATSPGLFVRDVRNFGKNSNYVRINALDVVEPSLATYAEANVLGWNRFIALMNNPANYPDVLILANWYNYFDNKCWDLIKDYIDAGGNVFYTHDRPDASEHYAQRGISNILGQTIGMVENVEWYGVYKYTDTKSAVADSAILKGPFGDVRPYTWGQDRIGTGYITGYTGNDVIVYSTHSQNYNTPSKPGMAFFRHKTKSFFFVGDGGFYNNNYGPGQPVGNFLEHPFRINSNNFPVVAPFGSAAVSGSPGYPGGLGSFTIANSIMFGNVLAWMLNRAHYYPIDRTGSIRVQPTTP